MKICTSFEKNKFFFTVFLFNILACLAAVLVSAKVVSVVDILNCRASFYKILVVNLASTFFLSVVCYCGILKYLNFIVVFCSAFANFFAVATAHHGMQIFNFSSLLELFLFSFSCVLLCVCATNAVFLSDKKFKKNLVLVVIPSVSSLTFALLLLNSLF